MAQRSPNKAIQRRAGRLAEEMRARGETASPQGVQGRREARQETNVVEGAERAEFVAEETGRAVAYGAASGVDETIETALSAGHSIVGGLVDAPEGTDEGADREREEYVQEGRRAASRMAAPSREVTLFRDAFGVEPPTSAAGQIGAGIVQLVTGAVILGPAGKAAGLTKVAGAVGKGIAKAAPKMAASPVARAAGKGAAEGQVAFGLADFAAFDADEARILVAMNESPALARFIPDFLAADDPDAPEWERRFYRMAEGIGLGGIAGGMLSGAWAILKRSAHAKRAGRPGDVMDHPAKNMVREAQKTEAYANQVKLEDEVVQVDADVPPEVDEAALAKPAVDLDLATIPGQRVQRAIPGEGAGRPLTEDERGMVEEKIDDGYPEALAIQEVRWPEEMTEEQAQYLVGKPTVKDEADRQAELQEKIRRFEEKQVEEVYAQGKVPRGLEGEIEEELKTQKDLKEGVSKKRAIISVMTRHGNANPFPNVKPPRLYRPIPEKPKDPDKPIVGLTGITGHEPRDLPPLDMTSVVNLNELKAPSLAGLARDTGLSTRVGVSPEFKLIERNSWARVREAEADTAVDNSVRLARAEEALDEWRKALVAEMKLAREQGWSPRQLDWLGKGRADRTLRTRWEAEQRDKVFHNEGMVHPDLATRFVKRKNEETGKIEEFEEPGWDGDLVTRRAVPVTELQEARPKDFGAFPKDEVLESQRPEMMDTLLLSEGDRGVLGVSRKEGYDRPLDVHFGVVKTEDDIEEVARQVITMHALGERARPRARDVSEAEVRAERARQKEAAEKGEEEDVRTELERAEEAPASATEVAAKQVIELEEKRVELRKQSEAVGKTLRDVPKEIRKAKKKGDEALVKKLEESMEMARTSLSKIENSYIAIQKTLQAGSDRRSAEAVMTDLFVRSGYGATARSVRDGLDPNAALHIVEAAVGSMQRLATAAASDGANMTQRAIAVRALHTTDAVLQWVKGNDRAVKDALKRASSDVEDDYTKGRGQKIRRRLNDDRLISQSGGTQRVQARLAGLALARDVGEGMAHLNAWRRDAGVAWGLGRRLGVNNIPRAALMVRMGGILSRPGTTTAGALGNFAMAELQIAERFVSDLITDVGESGLVKGVAAAAQSAADRQIGVFQGIADGAALMRNDLAINMRGHDAAANARDRLRAKNLRILHHEFDRMDQFENAADFTVSGIRRDLVQRPDTRMAALAENSALFARGALTWSVSMQRGVDMIFKSMNYRGEITALAWKQARKEFPDGGAEMNKRAEELIKQPSDEMFQQAMKLAHTNTFTGESVRPVEAYVNAMRRYPGLRHLTTIVRTPANVVTEGIRRLPGAGFVLKRELDAWKQGGAAKNEVIARQLLGGVGYMTLVPLVVGDRLTGAMPTDPQEAAAWRALGKRPYSFKLPGTGTWVDYRYPLGPFALPMAIGSTFGQIVSGWDGNDETMETMEDGVSFASTLIGYLVDETFLGDVLGWSDVALGEMSTDRTMEAFVRWGEGYTPLSALQRSIMREFIDDSVLMDYEASGGRGGSSEGMSEKVGEAVDTLGRRFRDLMLQGGADDVYARLDHQGRELDLTKTGGSFLSWFAPTRYTAESTDRLDLAEHEVQLRPPRWDHTFDVRHPNRLLERRLDMKVQVVEPTPRERHRLNRRAGQLYREAALRYLDSESWRRNVPAGRRRDLGELLKRARVAARREVLDPVKGPRHYKDLRDAIREAEALQTSLGQRELAKERQRRARAA